MNLFGFLFGLYCFNDYLCIVIKKQRLLTNKKFKYMVRIHLKFNDNVKDVKVFTVDSIYQNNAENEVVLHFSKDVPFSTLLELSYQYKLELYKYADDKHVGLTVSMDDIFHVQYN